MSDANFNARVRRSAERKTQLQRQRGRDGERLFLLQRGQQSGTFISIVEITTGVKVDYNEDGLRGEELFVRYATTDDMSDTWAKMTHIGFGVPILNKVFVYEIQQKDSTIPSVRSLVWKAFATRDGKKNERHTIVETNYLTYNGDRLTYNGDYLTYNP